MNEILYISQSPLQLINNIEAWISLERKKGKHLIFIRNKHSMEAIESVISLFQLKNYKMYNLSKFFRLFFPFILNTETKKNYEKIYFGNTTFYTSFLINRINPSALTHVDDGTRTISLLQLDESSKFFTKPVFSCLDKSYLKRSKYFTYYTQMAKESKKAFIGNTLSNVSQHIVQLEQLKGMKPAGRNQKIFIGTNILKSYENIEQIFNQLDTQIGLQDSIYLMHRYDDPLLINRLAQRHNFNVFKINLPIELYFRFFWQINQPSVWTFGSTAIDTLTLISKETRFNVIKLNIDKFSKPTLREGFQKLYEHFDNNPMVTLHELNQQPT